MTPIQEQILRSALFVPCNTKKELHRWIKMYLGIDMPDVIVCDDDIHHPPSNSSPMDLIWEIYYKARQGVDPSFQEVLAYAARDSFKTLSASIIELLCIVHLKRDVVHLAAIETQAKFCLDYIRKFLSRPILKEFITNVSRRELTFSRYVNEDETISPVQYKKLSELEKIKYEEEKYKVHITVATVEACNGLHAPFMCVSGDTEVSIQGQGLATVEELASDCLGGADRLVESFEIPVNNVSILSMDPESYELSFKPVTRIKREKRKIVKVKLAIGNRKAWANGDIEYKTIECTPDHKFYVKPFKGQSVKGWWIEAQGLKPDWSVFSAFDEAKVISVRNVTEEKYVYDLAVEGTHTFIANDIVVHNCMDELDIAPPDAFMEAKSIPSSTKDRKLPITFYTSTRKYSYGLVQKEIDRSFTEHTGLQIRHWNFIDVTEKCPTDRHLPEEPKIDIWVNEDILSSLSQEDFDKLPETEKKTYEKLEGYSGCLKNCKIFSSCKGRLATKQTSTSPLLKRVDQTQSNIRKVSLEHAKAQYLCWKPSTAGLVYPYFSREVHEKTASEMVEIFTGEPCTKELDKNGFIKFLQNSGAQFFSGIDWGYTHNYVVVTGAIIAHYLFIIDVIAAGELELPDIIDITKKQVGHLKPICFPDSAYPANIQSFRTNGFVMVDFHKDVLEGVKAVRERLTPGMDRKPTMYFLKGDAGVDGLIKEIQTYHWKLDKAGNLTDDPDKVDDDRCDALRYLCQNVQINKSRFIVSTDFKKTNKTPTQATMENFLKNKINELTGEAGLDADPQILGDEGGIKFVI